jgi:ABC-type Fe3+ transport system permease subunit
MIFAFYIANPLVLVLLDFKPIIPYLLQITNSLNKSRFSYKKQDFWPRNVNALLLAIISSLIVILYALKITGLPLRKNNSAKTLS